VSPIDITTTAGYNTFSTALMTGGTPVRVYGVPTAVGAVQGYVVLYYTGSTMPAD
jgi:hypothetical protein